MANWGDPEQYQSPEYRISKRFSEGLSKGLEMSLLRKMQRDEEARKLQQQIEAEKREADLKLQVEGYKPQPFNLPTAASVDTRPTVTFPQEYGGMRYVKPQTQEDRLGIEKKEQEIEAIKALGNQRKAAALRQQLLTQGKKEMSEQDYLRIRQNYTNNMMEGLDPLLDTMIDSLDREYLDKKGWGDIYSQISKEKGKPEVKKGFISSLMNLFKRDNKDVGEIRVRIKATGETGSIPEEEFDPSIYERL